MPAWVPPATRMLSPARTEASRKPAACGVMLPSSTRPPRLAARSTNLRMLTAEKPRLMPSRTTWSRWPSGSIASTNGRLMSTRRPDDFSIRSVSSCTCAVVSIRLVSSWRPLRAMKTRLGSLIQISSTDGSSRKGWSGPKPETRATSSPTTESTSGTGATTPLSERSSWSRTTPSAIRRTSLASRCGSTPSRRTWSRTCASRLSTSAACASVIAIATPVPSEVPSPEPRRLYLPLTRGSCGVLWTTTGRELGNGCWVTLPGRCDGAGA